MSEWNFRPFMDGLPSEWTPSDGLEEIEKALGEGWAQQKIAEMGIQVIAMLLGKNRRYGNSALDPLKVFAQDITSADKIRIRLDDKLSRIYRGENFTDGERPEVDMAGYLILLLISEYEEIMRDAVAQRGSPRLPLEGAP